MPPPNFGIVEEDLYRSGEPSEINFPFLEKLCLARVIYLAPDDPSRALYVVPILLSRYVPKYLLSYHFIGPAVSIFVKIKI